MTPLSDSAFRRCFQEAGPWRLEQPAVQVNATRGKGKTWCPSTRVRRSLCKDKQPGPPAVPSVLFTSPGMVWALFLSFTEHPKSPSLISPEEVRKILAPKEEEAYR